MLETRHESETLQIVVLQFSISCVVYVDLVFMAVIVY